MDNTKQVCRFPNRGRTSARGRILLFSKGSDVGLDGRGKVSEGSGKDHSLTLKNLILYEASGKTSLKRINKYSTHRSLR